MDSNVIEKNGAWYFTDIDGKEHGPYFSDLEAHLAASTYVKGLELPGEPA